MMHSMSMLIVLAVAAAQQPPDAAPTAFTQLEHAIRAEAERLKRQLLDTHAATDYGNLLEAKATVDSSLIPAWLMEDAAAFCQAVTEGREPPDMLCMMRAEYGQTPVLSEWSHPGGAHRAARALAGWAALAGGQSACHASTASMRARAGDSTPYIRWTVSAVDRGGTPHIEAQAHWYEPCLETVHLDWPLTPHALRISWGPTSGTIVTGTGVQHTEHWAPRPLFNNPTDVYALHDALRARRCVDMEVKGRTRLEPAPAQEGADSATVYTRTIRRTDGSIVRVERWAYEADMLREITIEQPALRFIAHTAEAFEIRQEVGGVLIEEPETYHPTTTLEYPPGGMRLEITFRDAHASQDALPSVVGVTVPDVVQVFSGGRCRARVTFGGFTAGTGAAGEQRVARALAAWQASENASADQRTRAAEAVSAACVAGDTARLREECEHLGRMALADGVPVEWALANVARVRHRLAERGLSDAAAVFSASVASDENADTVPVSSDASDLSPARTALFAAIRSGLRALAPPMQQDAASVGQLRDRLAARAHARQIIAAFEHAALGALRVAPDAVDAPGGTLERLTPRAAHDMRCLVAHSIDELSAPPADDTHHVLHERCTQFAARVLRTLTASPDAHDDGPAIQAAIRRAAAAARDAARTIATAWRLDQTATNSVCAGVRASIMDLECLAGNAWAPDIFGAWVMHATQADFAAYLSHAMEAHGTEHTLAASRQLPGPASQAQEALSAEVAGVMRGLLVAPTPPAAPGAPPGHPPATPRVTPPGHPPATPTHSPSPPIVSQPLAKG